MWLQNDSSSQDPLAFSKELNNDDDAVRTSVQTEIEEVRLGKGTGVDLDTPLKGKAINR